jgi:hypothetical protein
MTWLQSLPLQHGSWRECCCHGILPPVTASLECWYRSLQELRGRELRNPTVGAVAAGVNPHFFAGTLRRADASRHLGWPSVTDQ